MNITELANFVEGAKALIEVQNHTIHQQADTIAKQASASKVSISRQLLLKAASAVHTLKGSPSAISVDTIADAWEENPSSIADTIIKLASDQAESIVSGAHMVRSIKKASNAETADDSEASADESFWSRRAQR
jgi:hypothetical protein